MLYMNMEKEKERGWSWRKDEKLPWKLHDFIKEFNAIERVRTLAGSSPKCGVVNTSLSLSCLLTQLENHDALSPPPPRMDCCHAANG